jgi:molybdate transport repressor ModE-like protein
MFTLRQFRAFEAVATTGHFGAAARLLHVSQPALSAQVAAMEETFGGPLLERRPGGTILTRDGEEVLARVRHILAEVRDLETLGRACGEVLTGRLRIPGLTARSARASPTRWRATSWRAISTAWCWRCPSRSPASRRSSFSRTASTSPFPRPSASAFRAR